jgi:hypothetical protein
MTDIDDVTEDSLRAVMKLGLHPSKTHLFLC